MMTTLPNHTQPLRGSTSLQSQPRCYLTNEDSCYNVAGGFDMPLRDHFHPPISKRSSWEGFHAQWPAMVVMALNRKLPAPYVAEPRVHLGAYYEIDIGALEE